MFEKFINKLQQEPRVEPNYVNMNEFRYMNPNLLNEQVKDISLLEDNQLLQILIENYSTVLEEIFEKENNKYIKLMKNIRFINIYTHAINHVISRGIQLKPMDRLYINKLVYNYITSSVTKDETVKSSLINLSKIINRDILPQILGLGIPDEIACSIALSRYSSIKEEINIKRVNFILLGCPIDLITEQVIIDLYSILFSKMSMLFETTMFDDNIDNTNTEDEGEIYSRISNALLIHLENMSLENISTVIRMYANDYKLLHDKEPVRFSLNSLNFDDYPRINQIVEYLTEKGYYIP